MSRKMKESGITAVGTYPLDWQCVRIKFLFENGVIKSGPYGSTLKNITVMNGEYPIYNQANVISNDFMLRRNYIDKDNFEKMSRYQIASDDVVFSMMGTVGKCSIVPKDIDAGIIDSHLFEAKLNTEKIDPSFFCYAYDKDNCSLVLEQFIEAMNGSIMNGLNGSLIKNAFICLPSLPEQHAIVSFLDRKCSAIDTAIAKTKESIEKLEEYKKTVITKAVTKGLDPDAKMKDSGIEWIGEVPENWEVEPIKYLFRILKRIAGKEGYDVISITQKGLRIRDVSNNEGQVAESYAKYQFVYPGDFAMNHMDLLTGGVGLSDLFGVTSPDYRVFRRISEKSNNKYYEYVFRSCYWNKIFYGMAMGIAEVGRKRLQAPVFLNIKFPAPPTDEQARIAKYLDHKCSAIDALIAKKQTAIEKWEEYKKSLIYYAVTGKIDCRTETTEGIG